jgi:phosphohistidine phosphatase
MLTLSLFRHAKSAWDEPGLEDFERPLAKRGEAAAPRMGAFMAANGIVPQLILCSPAVRTRQTVDLILPFLRPAPTVEYEEALYLAAATVLLARVRKVGRHVGHLMLVGHNPGMHGLAAALPKPGDSEEQRALGAKFSTAGLAVITFQQVEWRKVRTGSGRLEHFMVPKRLP